MKLHRASKKPDWDKVAERRRNTWQRLAKSTKGVVTLGNLLTAVGFVLTVLGLVEIAREQYVDGMILLAIGRLCDLVDGWIADKTGTKSPLGEALDAAIDKLEVLIALVVLWAASIVPGWAIAALAIPHAFIGFITVIKRTKHKKMHPSRAGKISMALAWLSISGFVILEALHAEPASVLAAVVYVLTVGSFALGMYAGRHYIKARP